MIFWHFLIVRNVISRLGNQSDPRPDRGRLLYMAVCPLSRSATLKGGHAGAREPTFTVPTVPPQTLATRSDREGAEARRTAHNIVTTIASSTPTPPTPNHDRHHHYVVLLVDLRYIYVIPRL
jgi:hypothetical protein